MKAQKKLTAGIAVAIIAVLIAFQSVNRTAVTEKVKDDGIKTRHIRSHEDEEKVNDSAKQGAIRDLSSGAENTH